MVGAVLFPLFFNKSIQYSVAFLKMNHFCSGFKCLFVCLFYLHLYIIAERGGLRQV